MPKDFFNLERFNNYWRNLDKNIFFCFIILFFLGIYFLFLQPLFLAGERLNKDFYFFFSKHLFFAFFAILLMIFIPI